MVGVCKIKSGTGQSEWEVIDLELAVTTGGWHWCLEAWWLLPL